MKLPNFFIIGAPKSGTTGLYDTIRQHPDIYMSPIKEPKYFACNGEPPVFNGPAGQHVRRTSVWTPLDYGLLFADVEGQRAIGEASPLYMRTPQTAPRIRRNLPQSRLVAILRQPAERAYSSFTFFHQHEREPAKTFQEALAQEALRMNAGWYFGLFHKEAGFYHAQLSAYYDLFPREQIRVYLYEDWKERPHELLRDLFGFLEVDDGFRAEIKKTNVTRWSRNRLLRRLASGSGFERELRRFLPENAVRKLRGALQRIDRRFNRCLPPPLDPALRAELTEEYREDILKLQDLLDRDLSRWLAPRAGA